MTKEKEVKVKAPKMNARVKKRWIEALRSGEYKQANGQLREMEYPEDDTKPTVVGYCCLGVLCDVYANSKAGKGTKWKDEDFLGESTYLPTKVRDWAGLPDENVTAFKAAPGYHLEPIQEALTTLNDTVEAGFKRIANWIEKNL